MLEIQILAETGTKMWRSGTGYLDIKNTLLLIMGSPTALIIETNDYKTYRYSKKRLYTIRKKIENINMKNTKAWSMNANLLLSRKGLGVMIFSATFNNISVISWR